MPQIKVIARMSRNYGPVTMEYELQRDVDAEKIGDATAVYDSMTKALLFQFGDFEKTHLPTMPIPSSRGIQGDTKPEGKRWYQAKNIYMSLQQGKKYFFIRPGNEPKYAKYGFAVYFDRMEGLTQSEAMDLLDKETFEHTFPEGMMVLVEMYKGKPRAIQLAHKSQIGEG